MKNERRGASKLHFSGNLACQWSVWFSEKSLRFNASLHRIEKLKRHPHIQTWGKFSSRVDWIRVVAESISKSSQPGTSWILQTSTTTSSRQRLKHATRGRSSLECLSTIVKRIEWFQKLAKLLNNEYNLDFYVFPWTQISVAETIPDSPEVKTDINGLRSISETLMAIQWPTEDQLLLLD